MPRLVLAALFVLSFLAAVARPAAGQEPAPRPVPTIEGGGGMIGSDVPGAPCTLVELAPGYPGYRGFVTGLFGPGEAACLEELQRHDPWFDRAQQDAENLTAAARLGLAGDPSQWVWENWLEIEAERGLPLTCYIDAYRRMAAGEPYVRAAVDQFDIRLQVGSIDSNDLLGRTAVGLDVPNYVLQQNFQTDYYLRATAWLTTGLAHANAPEILAAIDLLIESMHTQGGGIPIIHERITTQGGYAPVPRDACPDDQIFIATMTLPPYEFPYPGELHSAMVDTLHALGNEWRGELAQGSDESFRRFLKRNTFLR